MAGIALFGGIAGALGLVLALSVGTSWRRSVGLVLLGLGLSGSWLFFAYFMATPGNEPRPNCSDCGVYFGRWWEPGLALFIIGTNFLAWTAGVFVGSAVRALQTQRRIELG
jgi:hypothetical protein